MWLIDTSILIHVTVSSEKCSPGSGDHVVSPMPAGGSDHITSGMGGSKRPRINDVLMMLSNDVVSMLHRVHVCHIVGCGAAILHAV